MKTRYWIEKPYGYWPYRQIAIAEISGKRLYSCYRSITSVRRWQKKLGFKLVKATTDVDWYWPIKLPRRETAISILKHKIH